MVNIFAQRCAQQAIMSMVAIAQATLPRNLGKKIGGPNRPLTKACGLENIAIQRPLGKLIKDYFWDIQ